MPGYDARTLVTECAAFRPHLRSMPYLLRTAARADQGALQHLIARSARELGAQDYKPEQIEAAHRPDLKLALDVLRNLHQILLVFFRNHDQSDSAALRGQYNFLFPAHG